MPDVNWRGVKGIRELIAHRYDDIAVEALEGVIRDNLGGRREAVDEALARA